MEHKMRFEISNPSCKHKNLDSFEFPCQTCNRGFVILRQFPTRQSGYPPVLKHCISARELSKMKLFTFTNKISSS